MKSYNQGVLVSPGATGSHSGIQLQEIENLTSLSYSFSIEGDEFPVYGENTFYYEKRPVESVDVNLSYYLTNFKNEEKLGLNTDYSAGIFSSEISKEKTEKNYYICANKEGYDLVGALPGTFSVFPVSNCVVDSYSVSAEVGRYAQATINSKGLNMASFPSGSTRYNPAIPVNTGTTVEIPLFKGSTGDRYFVKPGDIRVDLGHTTGMLHRLPASCVQSFQFDVSLPREDIYYLSSNYPGKRVVKFPIPFELDMNLSSKNVSVSRLDEFFCKYPSQYINIGFGKPFCENWTYDLVCGFSLRNLSLVSQEFITEVGGEQSISLKWRGQIGSFNDQDNGVFLFRSDTYSGVFSTDDGTFFSSTDDSLFSP